MNVEFEVGDEVLISYPSYGSIWGTVTERYELEGRPWFNVRTYEESPGHPYVKEGYHLEEITMNFPATCVRKAYPAPDRAVTREEG